MSTIAERVQAGCEFLDQIRPGWETSIDLTVLDLSDCTVCVVGQVGGPEAELGLWALTHDDKHLDDGWPVKLGFNDAEEQYSSLTRAWKKAIRARLSASAAPPMDGLGSEVRG